MKKLLLTLLALMLVYLGLTMFIFPPQMVNQAVDDLAKQAELDANYFTSLESNHYTFADPKFILNPYGNSPLTALIMFKTPQPEIITIEVLGKDNLTTFTATFAATKTHLIPVYGLYPNQTNTVTISTATNFTQLEIETAPLPTDFILPETKPFKNPAYLDNQVYFVSPAAAGYMAAYDVNGDVRWYLSENYAWDIQRLKNGHLLIGSNRLINSPYYSLGLLEIDLLGKIYQEYLLPGGYHHDVYELNDEEFLVASNDFSSGTVEDVVVLLDRQTGLIKKSWNLTEILPQATGKSENWIKHDWFHNNSVAYDAKHEAIILSGRHLDAVISLDFNTGALNWILGDKTNWDPNYQKYFLTPLGDNFEWQWSQHAAKVLPDGNILLFDNGNNKSKIPSAYVKPEDSYSRAVIYSVDYQNLTVTQLWQYGKERGSSYYSPYISEADYLGDHHYLVHSGGIGEKDGSPLNQPGTLDPNATLTSITTELFNDQVIFELTLPSNFYRAEKMAFYHNDAYSFTLAHTLGALNKTRTSDAKLNSWLAFKFLPAKYELTLSQEKERLVVSGTFEKGSLVYLILEQGLNKEVYQIFITETPYTAMCIGLFNPVQTDENLIKLNYYVNKTGLNGKYRIKIKIDKIVYDTNKYVIFD